VISKRIQTELEAHEVFWCFQEAQYPVFLDSGMGANNLGRYSIMSWNPFLTFESKKNRILIKEEKMKIEFTGNTFDELSKLYNKYHIEADSEIPFIGGFLGYFGYDLCHQIETLKITTIDDTNLPDCFMGLYDGAVVFDHFENTVWLVDSGVRPNGEARIASLEEKLSCLERPQIALTKKTTETEFTSNFKREDYLKSLTKLKGYIQSGDIYQANLTQRFTTEMTQKPIELYYKLRTVNPAPFAAFMPLSNGAVVSSSPERLVKIDKNMVETRPIKGTRPRGATPEEDAALKAELIASEKDRSELLMIVDLERNDLSKIAKTGTVKVPELMVCETYPTVFHLVSTVTAQLKEAYNPIDVVRSIFPGGSITGAPKIRAMEIIDELEPTQRSVYTGSIGYIGFNGQTDLNIAIRTILCHHNIASFQAGGGIVWDSDEVSEYEETLTKAKAMMRALSY
jgi:para-aminobenzoate synthetase component 1